MKALVALLLIFVIA